MNKLVKRGCTSLALFNKIVDGLRKGSLGGVLSVDGFGSVHYYRGDNS